MAVLLLVTVLSQVAAEADNGDSQGAATADVARVSPVVGDNFRISGAAATGEESDPEVAYNSTDNQYLVVWHDDRNLAGRGHDIYGRLIEADGTPIRQDFRISGPLADHNEWDAAVTYNPVTNQYLVVWEDERNYEARGSDIYGRRIKANGRPAGGDFLISGPAATSDEYDPAVAYNQILNQYLIVWNEQRNAATRGSDIYGRRIKANGRPAGGDFLISGPAATSEELAPAVVYNANANQFFVAWQDFRNYPDRGGDIYGRRVTAKGQVAGAEIQISGPAATGNEWDALVAYNSTSDQYLVVWGDERNHVTQGRDVYGRRIKANGNLVGADIRISGPGAVYIRYHPAVAYSSITNQYLVVWGDNRKSVARDSDMYGRRVKATGSPLGHDFRISDAAGTERESLPAVAYNSTTNQYLVVWGDDRKSAARKGDIYGQLIAG
ncbi:MAG: hypothetical protein KKE89_03185 [Actinobacteria bacterium]|nr:hypothetical protein [Actinomycetota bacterium]